MSEWTQIDAGGRLGESLAETEIPPDAEHIKGWHRDKAEGLQVYSDEGMYWVIHTVTGRVNSVQEASSLDEALETAKRLRKNV